MIMQPVLDDLVAGIIDKQIDVIVVDPFVSGHEVKENDNNMQDMVVKEWGRVADRGNCAVHLVDHTRKMNGFESEVTTESSRGAKAKTDAARVVRVVNRMTKEEAERTGVQNHRLHFRTFNDKANLAPPADKSDWFELKSVDLGNGPGMEVGGVKFNGPGDSVGWCRSGNGRTLSPA
jgi:RecA-family ATPase